MYLMPGLLANLLLAVVTLGSDAAASRARAEKHYRQAVSEAGLALAAAGSDKQLAGLARREMSDLLCHLLDAEGCLQLRAELGDPVRSYLPLLSPESRLPDLAAAQACSRELQAHSRAWGHDAALAGLALAVLERARGDVWAARAATAARPQLERARRLAAEAQGATRLRYLLEAGRAAWQALDHEALASLAEHLADALAAAPPSEQKLRQRCRRLLERGEAACLVAGERDRAAALRRARESLETKALAAPELDFQLGPDAGQLSCDLPAAGRQWRSLWDELAPRPDWQRRVAGFMTAYLAVLLGDGQAFPQLPEKAPDASPAYLEARLLGLRGRQALQEGLLWQAAERFRVSLRQLDEKPELGLLRAATQANLAQVNFLLGRYRLAAEQFTEAGRGFARGSGYDSRALLGAVHAWAFAGDLTRAGELLRQAAAQGASAEQALVLDLEQGLLQVMGGNVPEARRHFERAVRDAARLSRPRDRAVALVNLAELDNDEGDFPRALERAREALELLRSGPGNDLAWQAYTERARAHTGLARHRQAREDFDRAMELVENLRAHIATEGSRRSFQAAKARLYRHALLQARAAGDRRRAFLISERARGRAFLDMLAERRLRSHDSRRDRFWQAQSVRRGRLPLGVKLFAPAPPELERRASQNAGPKGTESAWAILASAAPAPARQVQRLLAVGELLVSYFHDGERLLIMGLTHRRLTLEAVEVSPERLGRRVKIFLRLLRRPDRPESRVQRQARKLYALLLEPVLPDGPVRRLTVVPWGPLHYLPWMALHDGRHYLLQRAEELAVVPSASTLVMLRTRDAGSGAGVLALGNPRSARPPLPAAAREARLVAGMFQPARLLLDEQARKDLLVSGMERARIVHLATHGVFLAERPLESYLVVDGADGSADRLPASEILQLDLDGVQLVTLSACETARSEVAGGEELVGLSRAFFQAGAGSLVASLWPVDDQATAELVRRFYAGFRSGASVAGSLVAAARRLRRQEGFSHPFFWAAFVSLGG